MPGLPAMLAWAALAQAAPVPPAQGAVSPASAPHTAQPVAQAIGKDENPAQAVDLDVIGYLGDYGDAADGLDPMGLAENAKGASPPPAPNKKQGERP